MSKRNNSNKKLSPEELAKTQVLNLSDVEKIAKYEKSTSKKPAIILAFIGLLSITMGLMYPSITSFIDKKNNPKEEVTLNREDKTEDTSLKNNVTPTPSASATSTAPAANTSPNQLTCTLSTPSTADGTDKTLTYNFTFANNLLQTYTKLIVVNPTKDSPIGATTITNALTNYQKLSETKLTGYLLQISKTTVGFTLTVNIDLTKINQQTLPAELKQDANTNIEFALNNEMTAVKTAMLNAKYVCN